MKILPTNKISCNIRLFALDICLSVIVDNPDNAATRLQADIDVIPSNGYNSGWFSLIPPSQSLSYLPQTTKS